MASVVRQELGLQEKADILKTLGHPLRLKIVAGLEGRCCCVREIWECLHLPQAIVSQHLKILKERGVVVGRREGAKVCYSLKNEMMRDLIRALRV